VKISPHDIDIPTPSVTGSFYRLIFGKVVTEELFDDLLDDPAEQELLKEYEGKTNERLMIEREDVVINEKINWLSGEGVSLLNATLAHKRRTGARFGGIGDRTAYLARSKKTAIAEVKHHQAIRAKQNNDPPTHFMMNMGKYSNCNGLSLDVRNLEAQLPDIYHLDDYNESIIFARAAKSQNKAINCIQYSSVRHPGGENLVIFDIVFRQHIQSDFYRFDWDGTSISSISKIIDA